MGEALKPCPFCAIEMQRIEDSGLPAFCHPEGDCVLRNKAWYVRTDAAKWNTRTLNRTSGEGRSDG